MKPGIYDTLERIAATIDERKGGDAGKSYVAQLFARTPEQRKFDELRASLASP